MSADRQVARGECPACGMPVPLLKSQWGRGRAFACKACGNSIVVPQVTPWGFAAIVVCLFVASFYSVAAGALLVLLYALADWRFGPVRPAR